MFKIPYANIEKGTLLIASPDLDHGIFSRSVILLCEHTKEASFGVILNKPLDLEISEELGIFFDKSNMEGVRFCMGGPLQANHMMVLHSNANCENAIEICSEVFLGGDANVFQNLNFEMSFQINVCFGFTSWQSGQLEQEFFEGLWFISKASKNYVFFNPIEDLWKVILTDMGGKYASISAIPKDLSLN